MLLIGILVLVLFVAAARGTLEAFQILLPKNIFRIPIRDRKSTRLNSSHP